MGSVTKATPIQFINSKNHIKKWRGHKTALSGYYTCLSRDLLLMASGRKHTHTHTPTFANETFSRNQARVGRRPVRAWFKNPTCDFDGKQSIVMGDTRNTIRTDKFTIYFSIQYLHMCPQKFLYSGI